MRRRWSLRCVGWMMETVRDGHGAVMMYILLVMGLLTVVTTGVMLLISADLAAGIRQLQGVRVFNVAEAGVHYAMGRMQTTGASSYVGETTTSITDGSTVLGSFEVSVGCIDGSTLPCTGPYAAFRRVVSTGTLPVSGPRRTIVVAVEGFPEGLTGYAVCAYSSVIVNQGITIYGDVGSNGTITLAGPSGNYSRVRADPPPPFTSSGYYTGSARATGAISCSVGCGLQVQGTTTPFAPGPLCPTVTLPTFSPGTSDQLVPLAGWTMDASTGGYNWNDITVAAAGGPGGCTGVPPFSDLRIQTGAAGTTTVVNVRTLTMGRCGRLIILGDGRLDLRIGELTGQGLVVGQYGRFGMLPTDTPPAPAPAPAGRVIVWVRSTAQIPAAVQIDRASIIVGTFIVPYGTWDEDRGTSIGNMYGAVLAHTVDIDRDFVFTYDPTAAIPGATFGNFTRLRSWKDQ